MPGEPSEPFPMDELVARLDGEHRIEDHRRTSLQLIQAATVAETIRAIVRQPSEIGDARLICRRVAIYAFRTGIFGMTQEALGVLLGYPKRSARASFHALLRREERARDLPVAGPGRNANKGRRKRARH